MEWKIMTDSQLPPPLPKWTEPRPGSWGRGHPPKKHVTPRSAHLENVVLHVADLDGFAAVAILF